jgi:hypothetical protein
VAGDRAAASGLTRLSCRSPTLATPEARRIEAGIFNYNSDFTLENNKAALNSAYGWSHTFTDNPHE